MRDLKQGREGETVGRRRDRHLNTCRGGEPDKHVFQSVNVCVRGETGYKCVSHCMCWQFMFSNACAFVCMGGGL